MNNSENLLSLIEIPKAEQVAFEEIVKKTRNENIRTSQQIVDLIFEDEAFEYRIREHDVSRVIQELRENVWQEYLRDEVNFNAILMANLHKHLGTPETILNQLVNNEILNFSGDKLLETVKSLCGQYAGRVFPYIYQLALSNTQSRRSRAGKSFESIIYKIYEILGYEYTSQGKVGRKIFESVGLGKKVDSILPNVEAFQNRRNKTIIGTMKTSLRERWQEVAEEIERTKIPEIHLLTVDESIPKSKAREMANHNITVVTYEWVSESDELKSSANIISFEKYLFEEIPGIIQYWENEKRQN